MNIKKATTFKKSGIDCIKADIFFFMPKKSTNITLLGMAFILLKGLRILKALRDLSETDGIGIISINLKWMQFEYLTLKSQLQSQLDSTQPSYKNSCALRIHKL